MQDKDEQKISQNEWFIIQALRSLKPFERLEIVADKQGKVNNYLVHRSSKVVLTDINIYHVA